MKLKDLTKIHDAIHSAMDFIESNTDSDESGVGNEMIEDLYESRRIIGEAINKKHVTNALQRLRKKKRKQITKI